MKPKIKVRYRKVTNPSLAIVKYYPYGHVDKSGREVIKSVVIKADPVINKPKNKKLKKIILKHEFDEIKARSGGLPLKKAHQSAVNKEPAWFTKEFNTHGKLQKGLRGK